MESVHLRLAAFEEADAVWEILQDAIIQRRQDGSTQWQNGYPNRQTVLDDIARAEGFVLERAGALLAYAAVITRPEPAYASIEGQWLSDRPYVVVHRVARARQHAGGGIAAALLQQVETWGAQQGIFSVRLDTNFDNTAMLSTLKRLGYTYCGEALYQGSPRMAFEKLL